MSYTITIQVYQTNPDAFFQIVEKTVFSSGTWTESNGEEVLTITGTGTSGTLRFVAANTENFLVALGVDSNKWCDIVTNLTNQQTGVLINPEYYVEGSGRAQAREAQRATYSVTNSQSRKFTVNYTLVNGNDLRANIIIG